MVGLPRDLADFLPFKADIIRSFAEALFCLFRAFSSALSLLPSFSFFPLRENIANQDGSIKYLRVIAIKVVRTRIERTRAVVWRFETIPSLAS